MAKIQYDVLSPDFLSDPYALHRRLREDDPVHWSESLGGWVPDALPRRGFGLERRAFLCG